MAEPLKNMFNQAVLEKFAAEIKAIWPAFNEKHFYTLVFDATWEEKALKQRAKQIAWALREVLPDDYPTALDIVVRTTQQMLDREGEKQRFEHIFLAEFVELYGLEHPDQSIPAMAVITRWISNEFAVRPYLLRYPERMYAQMRAWASHPSAMVRRLSSEGFRPRLPWGMGIPALKRDPSPILPVLEMLKNDPAETVRRSVANNLNDISKDHPDLALELAARWQGHSAETDWIVRHALRGLLKKGHAAALDRFGFEHGVDGVEVRDLQATNPVTRGERLDFSCVVLNTGDQTLSLRLEYAIDYQTLSGKISRKVFKIKEIKLPSGQSDTLSRSQRFQDFTTRKHFVGRHRLGILVNGKEMIAEDFEVV